MVCESVHRCGAVRSMSSRRPLLVQRPVAQPLTPALDYEFMDRAIQLLPCAKIGDIQPSYAVRHEVARFQILSNASPGEYGGEHGRLLALARN